MATTAIWSLYVAMHASKAGKSFSGSTNVSWAYASGTPADDDVPNVANPLPAFTSKASTWPW